MRYRSRFMLGGIIATLALAVAVGAANANRLAVSQQNIRAIWTELISMGGGIGTKCRVTLEGSFHSRTISKVSGALVGYINHAVWGHSCFENEAWALNGSEVLGGGAAPNTLPWHMLYLTFRGTLPGIRGVLLTLDNGGILVEAVGVSCLYEASRPRPIHFIGELNGLGEVIGLRMEESTRIPKKAGGFLCPAEMSFSGTASVTAAGTSNAISVRLVA